MKLGRIRGSRVVGYIECIENRGRLSQNSIAYMKCSSKKKKKDK